MAYNYIKFRETLGLNCRLYKYINHDAPLPQYGMNENISKEINKCKN